MYAVQEFNRVLSISLCALYLKGAPGAVLPKRRWKLVEGALRRLSPSLDDVGDCLSDAGLWAEGLALTQGGRLTWAAAQYDSTRCLSVADESYPSRLLKLEDAAPPAFWCRQLPHPQLRLAIVGSRRPCPDAVAFCREVAHEAVRLGYGVVSGGAAGCDTIAADAAQGNAIEIIPHGIDHHQSPHPALSLCAPDEPFSTGAAMERNALIYASSEQAIVASSRFREGGTWIGATSALRRKLCPLLIREAPLPGHRALIALGGRPIRHPADLAEALLQPSSQPALLSA